MGGCIHLDNNHHIEWSTPETRSALEAAIWEEAGNTLCAPFTSSLVKNTVDHTQACWGAHENYSIRKNPQDTRTLLGITPFLVTRQLFAGAGKYYWDKDEQQWQYRISARSPFTTFLVSLGTTKDSRGILCTRNEPLTDTPEKYGYRFHLILGDANRCPVALWLKLKTTALVLGLLQEDALPPIASSYCLDEREVLADLRGISKQTEKWPLSNKSVRGMPAVDVQWQFWQAAQRFKGKNPETDDALEIWADTLQRLQQNPKTLVGRVDWATKQEIAQAYVRMHHEPTDRENQTILETLDLQYHTIKDPDLSIDFKAFYDAGQIERLYTNHMLTHAVNNPPQWTRAVIRSKILRAFYPAGAEKGWGVYWDHCILKKEMCLSLIGEKTSFVPLRDPCNMYDNLWAEIAKQSHIKGTPEKFAMLFTKRT